MTGELREQALPLRELSDTDCKVVRVLCQERSGVKTRELAVRCGLVMNEVRWACGRLKARGLVSESKRQIKQVFGDKTARKIVSVWAVTEQGRDLAAELLR